MQAEGWYLRSTIIWAKGISFCDSYSGSVMPESLSGTRWEKHADCEGCPKCEANDGLVLRRGSWRCTSAYEYVFMFAKSSSYWSDGEGVKETSLRESSGNTERQFDHKMNHTAHSVPWEGTTRNLRNCWTINPQPFPLAHFATYPPALVEPLIKCSTSDRGVCPECGAQWARVVEHTTAFAPPVDGRDVDVSRGDKNRKLDGKNGQPATSTTLGWRPTCGCKPDVYRDINSVAQPIPATVLDPFLGSGTTLLTARKLGRHGIGIELSPEYADMARKRIGEYAPLFS